MFLIKAGLPKELGTSELVRPQRQGLNHHTGFHHDVKSNSRHVAGYFITVATLAIEDDRNVGVAVGTVGLTGAAAVQDRFAHRIAPLQMPQEGTRRAFGLLIERRRDPKRHHRLLHQPLGQGFASLGQINHKTKL